MGKILQKAGHIPMNPKYALRRPKDFKRQDSWLIFKNVSKKTLILQTTVLTSTPSVRSSTTILNLEPEYFDLVPTPEPPPFEKSIPSSLSTSLQSILRDDIMLIISQQPNYDQLPVTLAEKF